MTETAEGVDGAGTGTVVLAPWVDPDPARPLPFWKTLATDVRAHVGPRWRGLPSRVRALEACGVVVRSSGFHVTLVYRVAHTARGRLGLPGRVLAGLLFWGNRHFYGCAIAPTARLFGGLILPHPQGIVVGPEVVVGPRGWIFQNVTLGGMPGREGMPRVGSDARIYAGAVLTGPITVGDNVMVGANVVVHRDVPARTVVRCAPVESVPLPDRFIADTD